MPRRTTLAVGTLTALLLTAGQLAGSSLAGGSPADATAGGTTSADHLRADATGRLTVDRAANGDVVFAGAPAGAAIVNPGVTPQTGVRAAARAHLDRYGTAFGATRPGTRLVGGSVVHTVAGQDAVRFNQRVGGVPVIGAQVVVSLLPSRQLGSMLSTLSHRTKVPAATVSRASAARAARDAAARSAGIPTSRLSVRSLGRWLFDRAVLGAGSGLGARAVWQFEITSGPAVRRMLLVDDRTGGILLDSDQIQSLDRVVCDSNNVVVDTQPPCSSGFARTEGGPASAVSDVNAAYDLSGVVSDFYNQIGGIDLTSALGIDVGGVKKLASTVRFCRTGATCPYANAFWNGRQMYYGQDFAVADDVVGHEMTHGIVDQYSQLFYWGQSGAMNESFADIMGEIVDHRHASPGDSPTDWRLAEDLPIGAIRNLQDPTLFGDPDKMTSTLYSNDVGGNPPSYPDSGGVHSNSGVGNKTAYLVSQGGTFNGQTMTGIDGADTGLAKSAKLYLNVIQTLSSGSDYADLGRVLDQSCQALLGAATAGFTAADCVNVHKAGLATELAMTPTNAAQPADAPATCPVGTAKAVLFDSETGTPTSKFTAGPAWTRNSADWGSNATSGLDSWFARDLPTIGNGALVAATGISLPAGQPSYLWFQQWRLLDYELNAYFDGGTVEVDDLGDAPGPVDAAALPWVNGPTHTLVSQFGNPASGRKGFGGDSFGFVASRLDLSSYAGRTIKPQFSMNTDDSVEYIGWWLDDVTVYTCVAQAVNSAAPTVTGSAVVGRTLTANAGTWTPPDVTLTYAWLRNGTEVPGATATTYLLTADDLGAKIAVQVTGAKAGYQPGTATSAETDPVVGLLTAAKPTISGKAKVGKKLTAKPGTWQPSGVTFTFQWLRDGQAIPGATGSTYTLKKADKGSKLRVKVTGSKAGYVSASKTSASTARVT